MARDASTGVEDRQIYKDYNTYNPFMAHTTIAIPTALRDDLKSFGEKGETYAEIIERLVESAKERQIRDILMDTEGTIPVRVALEEAKRRWPS